jgi:spectinomycin phosphotransferase
MIVHPYLRGPRAGEDGQYRSAVDRTAVLADIVALHAATDVAAPHAAVESGFLPGRRQLNIALDHVDEAWPTGPYGEPARALLHDHATGVRALLAHYDRLVVEVCMHDQSMVVAHGEPHASNVVIEPTGPRLVDWESVLIAPPERDRKPHTDTVDAAESWKNLVEFLQPARRWPTLFR